MSKKYTVRIPYWFAVNITVEAEDEEAAIEAAFEFGDKPSLCAGNGGWDKLVGVTDTDEAKCWLEVGDDEMTGKNLELEIEVEEVDE